VIHDGGDAAALDAMDAAALDAMELRLREGGRCDGAASACMKQGGDASRSDACSVRRRFCVKEMRCVKMPVKERCLRRDKDTLMGCLLGWANHSLYICLFLVFLFSFFSFSFLFPAAILPFLRMVRRRLASPYGRLGVA
jgi:hypothetical protein